MEIYQQDASTRNQALWHCAIYCHTHPAGGYVGFCTYYAHRCLLHQLAQRWMHSVCAQPFTTTLISLGLIASVELLPCRLMILVGVLAWVLLPNPFSMFRHSTVKANAGQKNQHACIQNDNDQLWWIVPLCQNAWWHIGSEAPKIKQHAFMAGQKNQHAFIASQHALQCWGGLAARPPMLKTKCDYKKFFKLLCETTKRSL